MHYYNYKKWRLARYNPGELQVYGLDTNYPSYNAGGSTNARFGSNYSPVPITKEEIDNYPDSHTPLGNTYSINHPSFLRITDALHSVLDNLKYVRPNIRNHLHLPYASISHNLYPLEQVSRYVKSSPTSFDVFSNVGSDPATTDLPRDQIRMNREHLNQALANYAGNLFHNVFARYNEEHTNNPDTHANKFLPIIDQMEDTGNFPGLQDIPEDSIFHPNNIEHHISEYNPGANPRHNDLVHRKAEGQTPLTQKIEDMALAAGHHGAQLYKQYLDSEHPGTFEHFLLSLMDTSNNLGDNKGYNRNRGFKTVPDGEIRPGQRNISTEPRASPKSGFSKTPPLLQELILQMVQGMHLPTK